jgi:hypothetical protein
VTSEGGPRREAGVHIETAFDAERFGMPAVAVQLVSERDDRVTVELARPLPDGVTPSDVSVPETYADDWTTAGDRLILRRVVGPGETVATAFGLSSPEATAKRMLRSWDVTVTAESGTAAAGAGSSAAGPGGRDGPSRTSSTSGPDDGSGGGSFSLPFGRRGLVVLLLLLAVGLGSTTVISADGNRLALATELMGPTDPFDADTDDDGLPDGIERRWGGDPTDPDTDGDGLEDGRERALRSEVDDPDSDNDGLNDSREAELGFPLQRADIDGDGLNDSQELALGSSPYRVDTDGDGLPDAEEARRGTDPDDWDTDDDGLGDGMEVDFVKSDPTVADTDGDGVDDLQAARLGLPIGSTDLDGDGLDNGAELAAGSNPYLPDSDGDGALDALEVEEGTNPTVIDADGDGLSRERELELGTDPTNPDTDGDNLPDGLEASDDFPGDPLRMDILVEIDYMREERLSASDRADLREAFASAPVENPDGSTGVTLHLERSEQVPADGTFTPDDLGTYSRKYGDTECRGYHYAVLSATGVDRQSRDRRGVSIGAAIASNDDPFVFMHELGHDLGLGPRIPGVDSREIPFSTYESVMNYKSPEDALDYSDGDNGARDHDDWSYIETDPWTPPVARPGGPVDGEDCGRWLEGRVVVGTP